MATHTINSKAAGPLFGLLFLVIGLAVAAWGYLEIKNAQASKSWPTVEGKVTRSQVDERRERTTRDGRTRTRYEYVPEIRYQYSHEGRSYASGRISFGGTVKSRSRSVAQRVVDRYPHGKAVTVYVKPGKPEVSCLQTGTSTKTYIPLILGGVFAVVGVGVTIGGLIGKRTGREPEFGKWQ